MEEGRQIKTSIKYKLIQEKIMNSGSTSMKRMRNCRKQTEAMIKEVIARNMANNC